MSDGGGVTQREAAEYFGVTDRTIRNWKHIGVPVGDLKQTAQWLARQYGRGESKSTGGEESGDDSLTIQKLKAEIAKLHEEVRAKQLRNESTEGNLIDRDDVEQSVAEVFAMIRARMEAMPDEFEMRFPAETRSENKNDLSDYVRQILKEVSEWQPPAEQCDAPESDGAD